jgi:uncharacterized protein (DUF362 family)
MSIVSFVKIQGTTRDSFKKAISESLDLISYKFGEEVKKVVLKPNLCYYWDYSTGQTTDPAFVAAIIEKLREILPYSKTTISIVESDASAMKCKHAFKMLGYEKLSRDYNVELVNLSEDSCVPTDVVVNNQIFHFSMPCTIQNADLKINIPKIKYTTEKLGITCALKNIYGCNPNPKKSRYHSRVEEVIVALNKAMKFDLCLIDGIIVSGIQPRKLGLVMASEDPVAIDVAAAQVAGVKPEKKRCLHLAHAEGLGNLSFTPRGMPLGYFRDRYPRKDFQKKFLTSAYSLITHIGLNKKIGL